MGPGAKERVMAYPANFRYTKQHEWTDVKGDVATIGITDYAQHELGDVVFAELPKVVAKVEAGKSFGTVESVKAVSDLFAPVSGTVTEINEALNTTPEQVNKDANKTWMIKINIKNAGDASQLLSAADYEKFVAEEGGH